MNKQSQQALLVKIAGELDITDSSYELAKNRYEDLGKWFSRDESTLRQNRPHIFPQGSFRLGTVIKPINLRADFDLDLSCRLDEGVQKSTHSQYDLKTMVQSELELYRVARNIEEKLKEQKRCWRLNYQGQPGFHLDVVPCIPEQSDRISRVKIAMMESQMTESQATTLANLSVSITDNKRADYRAKTFEWPLSNPEGYAKWFESRMAMRKLLIEGKIAAKVDDLPENTRRTILQKCVQILKRHRDIFFRYKTDHQTISIIITTLAGRAYDGEGNLFEALQNILNKMDALISPVEPRIPNPVNPKEDFADKWKTPDGIALRLEENTRKWIQQAKTDLANLETIQDTKTLKSIVESRFGMPLSELICNELIPQSVKPTPTHVISNQTSPWLAGYAY